MKVSQKGEYGLRALLELARRYGQGPVQASIVAEAREIPSQYLQQILLGLRRAGLIRSERGPRGGHELARVPGQVTLLEAVEALEGTTAPAPCIVPGAAPVCSQHERCVFIGVWRQVDAATRRVLAGITLGDLARQEQQIDAAPMYFI
jgi:Rrf2 family protein